MARRGGARSGSRSGRVSGVLAAAPAPAVEQRTSLEVLSRLLFTLEIHAHLLPFLGD